MTVPSRTFQVLQSGIKTVDDLRVRGPVNEVLKYLSGPLQADINTQFAQVSVSISSALTTFRGTANTWTAAQSIVLTAAGTALTLQSNDAGAGSGPNLFMRRNSASPAASDILSVIQFAGNDSAGNNLSYADIFTQIIDPSDVSEDARLVVRAVIAGTITPILTLGPGVQIGSPTGGDPGVDNLNISGVIQKDGTQVVAGRVTGYGDPFGAISRTTISVTTVTTAGLASFVAAMYTDLKAHGLIGN